jgi:hypothetical protein
MESDSSTALGTLFVVGAAGLWAYFRSTPEPEEHWGDFVAEEKIDKFADVPATFGEWDDEFGCYTTLPRRVVELSFASNDEGLRKVFLFTQPFSSAAPLSCCVLCVRYLLFLFLVLSFSIFFLDLFNFFRSHSLELSKHWSHANESRPAHQKREEHSDSRAAESAHGVHHCAAVSERARAICRFVGHHVTHDSRD